MSIRKLLLITIIFISPLFLVGCNFAFAPGGGGGGTSTQKGVYKSYNQGQDWVEKNSLAESDKSLARYDVFKLAFDIFDTNILYQASQVGLFISQDAGDSWRQIYTSGVSDFVLNPKTRGIIYIASNNQVYKTTDNGKNWQLIYSGAKPHVQIASLAINFFDTSQIYILETDGTLLTSLDWGDSWKVIYNFEDKNMQELVIDPYNSQNIYAASQNRLYQSRDQGKSWQDILEGQRQNFPGIEQYKQLLFTNEPNHLIYLSKRGILTSADNGQSWREITLITSPNSVDIHSLSFNSENPEEMYYAVGNILYHTIDGGRNWKTINPEDNNILYLGITQQ
jgi:photosystem II stability/assembly factor-like uncharacterized protein